MNTLTQNICNLRVLQNNKALKQTDGITYKLGGLRVLQNNKALKPVSRCGQILRV